MIISLAFSEFAPLHSGAGATGFRTPIHGDGKIFSLQIDQNSYGGYFSIWFNIIWLVIAIQTLHILRIGCQSELVEQKLKNRKVMTQSVCFQFW